MLQVFGKIDDKSLADLKKAINEDDGSK